MTPRQQGDCPILDRLRGAGILSIKTGTSSWSDQ